MDSHYNKVMKKHFFHFIPAVTAVIALLSSPSAALAQGKISTLNDEEWQATLENIKSDTSGLLEANEQLNSEYDFLKQKLAGLQESFAKVKEQNTELQMENQKLETSRGAQRRSAEDLQQKLLQAQSEAGSLQTDNKPLRERLSRLEEQNQQLQTRLQELQGQKREMLLDLKLQEASQGETQEFDDDEIRKLNDQISRYEFQEKEFKAELESSQSGVDKVLNETETLVRENNDLEGNLAELKLKRDNQLKINAQLKKENERLTKSVSQGPADLVKQKSVLETKISALSKELDAIRKSVQDSASVLEKKRTLMDEVMTLDAENQALRDEIAQLLQKANEAESEFESEPSAVE